MAGAVDTRAGFEGPDHLRYALDVVEGRIVAGSLIKLACQRSLDDHARAANDPKWPWVWHAGAVQPRIDLFESLPVLQGDEAGSTFRMLDWQRWNTAEVWGWRDRDDPRVLRFRESILEVAKGNGKSPFSGIESLYALLRGAHGTRILSFASRLEQAKLCFSVVADILVHPACPDFLSGNFDVRKSDIKCTETGNIFEPMPSTSRNLDGMIVSTLILDEAASLISRDRIMDLVSATRKLRGSHIRWITTAQPGAQDRPYYEKRSHAIDVLQGRAANDRLHAAIYCIDPEDERDEGWKDPDCWAKANPSLGTILNKDMLQEAMAEAARIPSLKSPNLAKHLNVFSGSASSWLSHEEWAACADPDLHHPDPAEWLEYLRSQGVSGSVDIGVDLASTRDLTAATITLLDERDKIIYVHARSFCPESAIDRLPDELQAIWREAEARGVLTTTSQVSTDYSQIEEYIIAVHEAAQNFGQIGFDPHNAKDVIARLEAAGVPVLGVNQSIQFQNGPTKKLESQILEGKLRHDGDDFLAWQIGNCQLYRGANNNVKLLKATKDSNLKIDNVAALINCFAVLNWDSEPESGFQIITHRF